MFIVSMKTMGYQPTPHFVCSIEALLCPRDLYFYIKLHTNLGSCLIIILILLIEAENCLDPNETTPSPEVTEPTQSKNYFMHLGYSYRIHHEVEVSMGEGRRPEAVYIL